MMRTLIWGTKSGPAGVRAQRCNCLKIPSQWGDNLMGEVNPYQQLAVDSYGAIYENLVNNLLS